MLPLLGVADEHRMTGDAGGTQHHSGHRLVARAEHAISSKTNTAPTT